MIQAVLFDLDGTLADTAPDLGAALNYVLQQQGQAPLPAQTIRPAASHGAKGLLELGGYTPGQAEFSQLRQLLLQHYERNLHQQTSLFDGVPELLSQLDQKNIPWGIVTNKPGYLTQALLPHLAFPSPPQCVVSGDTCAQAKPHPAPMQHAATLLGVEPEYCLYVGDAERDIEAGKGVGMTSLVAAYGYLGPNDAPHTWGADGYINHPLQLLEWLD